MKLRNKKTGEILETVRSAMVCKDKFRIYDELTDKYYSYNSLAELNAEWEDYEEPEIIWYINSSGVVCCATKENYWGDSKQIGNYFETREEAEKAVDKLKAWKRLKDARFEFGTIKYNLDEESSSTIAYDGIITIKGMAYEDFVDDLDLVFGGEE